MHFRQAPGENFPLKLKWSADAQREGNAGFIPMQMSPLTT